MPIGTLLDVLPIEVPLPLILIGAHAPRYTYITTTSLAPSSDSLTSFDLFSSLDYVRPGTDAKVLSSDAVVPREASPTLSLISLAA